MEALLSIIGVYLLFYFIGAISRRLRQRKTGKQSSQSSVQFQRGTFSAKSSESPEIGPCPQTSRTYEVELPANFVLTDEFQSAFELMESTSDNIFITGRAGTGKSTLLQYFRKNTEKNIAVIAPTGVAALNVGGQTIHSFFKLPPRLIQKDDVHSIRTRNVIKKLEAVVIDEVSMVRADLMDGIDLALRVNRDAQEIPFGGVQIIVFGDLYQLPPVVESEMKLVFDRLYKSPYFFSSRIIQVAKLRCLELQKIHRQTDAGFVSLLNHLRDGSVDEEDLSFLNKRVVSSDGSCTNGVLILTTTNEGANRINERRLQAINEKAFVFEAQVFGRFDIDTCPAEMSLRLKKGAQVMLIRNDLNRRWVNGSMGHIASLSDNSIRVSLKNGTHEIQQETWEKIEYQYNPDSKRIEARVVGSFRQYPIKLAYAMTIHKSQGKTFDSVLIDLEKGAFAHGQAYVALSRCRTLEGIYLQRPLRPTDVIFDPVIYRFKEANFSPKAIVACSRCGQKLRRAEGAVRLRCPKCGNVFSGYS